MISLRTLFALPVALGSLTALTAAQAPLEFAIDSSASNFTYTGSTSLGPIVGTPNTFDLSGTVIAEVTAGSGQPIGSIAFPGGGDALVAPDIDAIIPNPVPFLPPLASITITNLRLDVLGAAVPVDASGNFSASVVSSTLSGIATVTPLGGTASVTDLAGTTSTAQTFAGSVTAAPGTVTLAGPLNISFMLTDAASGLTATVNLNGALQAVHTGATPVNYCTANPNSTGASAGIGSMGSTSISTADLTLTGSALPTNSLGYFLFSQTQGFVGNFGGSQGNLCLGGSLFRLSSFVQSSGGAGQVALGLPYGGLPAGAVIEPGETWNFQYWFRDLVGGTPTSNTTNGLSVTFLP